MRITLLILTLVMITACSTNNTRKETDGFVETTDEHFAEFCQTADCRKNTAFSLLREDGTTFVYESELSVPVIQPNFISIYPGETLYIEADDGDLGPENYRLVSAVSNPEQTLVFHFEQNTEIGDGTGMLLHVRNPFSRTIRYNIGMMPLSEDNLLKTSSCPVVAGGAMYEHWPYPIFQLVFANIRFLDEGDDLSCVE